MIDPTIHAVQTIEADLLWLTLPERPTCGTCEGDGRIGDERKVCPRCDGIGSTEPAKGTPSPYQRALNILRDPEAQRDMLRAAHPEGGTNPTEGSTAWSDPTGEAACRDLATGLRAGRIAKAWQSELAEAADAVRLALVHIDHATGAVFRFAGKGGHMGFMLGAASWMLTIPHSPLEAALRALGGDSGGEMPHALGFAAERSTGVRSGIIDGDIPSVSKVLAMHRRALEVKPAEPKVVQKPPELCVSCLRARNSQGNRIENYISDRYPAKRLCRTCGDYLSANGKLPLVEALELMERRGLRALTFHVQAEAERVVLRRRVG